MLNKLCFLIFLIASNSFGQTLDIDIDTDLKNEIMEAYETYKEIKKAGGFEVVPLPELQRTDEKLCIYCDSLTPLIEDVNEIILKTAEIEDAKNPENRTLEQVSGFDALYHYTFSENYLTGESTCERFDDSINNENVEDIDLEKSTILISDQIPIEKINAIQIRDKKKRTYFYRGEGEDKNIIIRIDVHDSEKAKVTYYRLKKKLIDNSNKEKKKKSDKEDSWELWASSSDEDEEVVDSSSDKVDYGVGISIEHKNNIPKKLTLVKGKSFTSVAEIFAVKTESEISTKKQQVSMSIASREGDDFAKIDLEKDHAELQIPMSIDILDSGLKLKTKYSITSNKEQKVYFSLDGEKGASTSLVLKNDISGTSAELSRTQKFGESQMVSFQIVGERYGEKEAWLRYELAF